MYNTLFKVLIFALFLGKCLFMPAPLCANPARIFTIEDKLNQMGLFCHWEIRYFLWGAVISFLIFYIYTEYKVNPLLHEALPGHKKYAI